MWRLAAVRRLQVQAAASVNASIQRKAHRHQPVGLHRLAVLHCRLEAPAAQYLATRGQIERAVTATGLHAHFGRAAVGTDQHAQHHRALLPGAQRDTG